MRGDSGMGSMLLRLAQGKPCTKTQTGLKICYINRSVPHKRAHSQHPAAHFRLDLAYLVSELDGQHYCAHNICKLVV